MNEQMRNMVLAISVGLIAGIGLLVGMSTVVTNALVPVTAKTDVVMQSQSKLERELTDKLKSIETKVEALDKKMVANPRMAGGDVQQRPQAPQMPQEDTTAYEIPVGDSYIFGKADAPVTIVEFSDLQCPFCSHFHAPLFEAVKAYPNDVRVVFKNFPLPFHENARPAAKAALAAGLQGKYYEMVALILQNQATLTEAKFKELAGQLGLNVEQFAKDLKDRDAAFEKKLADDMELGAKVNVPGTPTYYLNGKKNNARSTEMWKAAIDEALKAAKK
jgi:protein-disulfide isomerase